MKFFQRDPWYRRLVQRSIQTLLPRRKTSSLRSRLLAMTGIGALLVSGLTFAIASVGAIAWPNAPAGEATGGTMITYFHNAFGDPATGTGKSCSGSGLITGFKTDGTPRCISIPDLTTLLGGSMTSTTPTLTFTAPAVVMNGSGATLNWDTTNVSTCTKSGDWSGDLIGNQVNQSFTTPDLTSNKSYTLTCSNTAGTSVEQTVNITVTTPTLTFTATNTAIMSDHPATLNWDTTNVSTCTKSGDWSGDLIGNQVNQSFTTPALTSNKSYKLTCSNTAGTSVEQTVNITVTTSTTPTILMPTPSLSTVNAGSSVTLSWNATPATSCTTTGPSSDTSTWAATGLSGSGSRTFTPTVSGNYTVTCYNGSVSSNQSVYITVTAPTTPTILMPTPSLITVNAGSSVTLSWNATPATSCTTTGPSSDTSTWAATGLSGSGSRTFTPTVSGNYTVTCYNGSVSSNQSVYITVDAATATPESCFTFSISSKKITGYDSTCPKDVVIPSTIMGNTVERIGWDAFSNKQLTSVIIPNTVLDIDYSAFENNQLTSVTILSQHVSIGIRAFNNNQLPSNQAFIYQRNQGFEDKTDLVSYGGAERTNVIIPDGVKTIRWLAFYNTNLTEVHLPNTVTNIEASAFSSAGIHKINIPNGVNVIGYQAFQRNNLTSVTIPNSVTKIEHNAFYQNKLTSVTIPNTVTTIEEYAFWDQDSSNGTVYGPSFGYVKDIYDSNPDDRVFDKSSLSSYSVVP